MANKQAIFSCTPILVNCLVSEVFIEGVADKLAKYFSGHLAALWHTFACNFMGSVHLKKFYRKMDVHYCSEHPRITLVQ